jgi:hypothetical protein
MVVAHQTLNQLINFTYKKQPHQHLSPSIHRRRLHEALWGPSVVSYHINLTSTFCEIWYRNMSRVIHTTITLDILLLLTASWTSCSTRWRISKSICISRDDCTSTWAPCVEGNAFMPNIYSRSFIACHNSQMPSCQTCLTGSIWMHWIAMNLQMSSLL